MLFCKRNLIWRKKTGQLCLRIYHGNQTRCYNVRAITAIQIDRSYAKTRGEEGEKPAKRKISDRFPHQRRELLWSWKKGRKKYRGEREMQRSYPSAGPKTGSPSSCGRSQRCRFCARDYFSLVQFLMGGINIAGVTGHSLFQRTKYVYRWGERTDDRALARQRTKRITDVVRPFAAAISPIVCSGERTNYPVLCRHLSLSIIRWKLIVR